MSDFRNKGHFPNDDAATKLIWLVLRNLTASIEETTDRLGSGKKFNSLFSLEKDSDWMID
jgi:hypothetical protein